MEIGGQFTANLHCHIRIVLYDGYGHIVQSFRKHLPYWQLAAFALLFVRCGVNGCGLLVFVLGVCVGRSGQS